MEMTMTMNKDEVGLNLIKTIKKSLPNCVEDRKIFTYNGKYLKAIAFVNGLKNKKLDELKKLLKKAGFVYDFMYECYLKNDGCWHCVQDYRVEKDEFLENFVSWKVGK